MSTEKPAWSWQFAPDARVTLAPRALLGPVTWKQACGESTGKGVKVAVIDSGIDATHPGIEGDVQGLTLTQEYEYHVSPLAVPEQRQMKEPEQLMKYGAIALFVQQARLAKKDFCLTRANAATMVNICIRLYALPLAIELAAARITLLSLQALQKRLDRQLLHFVEN